MKPLNFFNKKYAGLLIVVVVVTILIRLYFLDAWLKAGIVGAGQAAVGAKVEIKSAHLAVLSGHVYIKGLSVGDRLHPFRNLIEVKLIDLDLSTRALLSGQVYIQNAQVSGIALGTARKSSATLKKPPPPKKVAKPRKPTKMELEAQKEVNKTVSYYSWNAIQSRLGLGALMDTSAFKFNEKLSKTSQDLNEWPAAFQNQLSSPNIEEKAQLVANQWDALQKNTPTDITKLPAYIKQVQLLQAQITSLNDLIADKQKKVSSASQSWQNQISDLNNQAAKDLATLQARIQTVQAKPAGAIKDIMGDQYAKVVNNVQDKVDMVLSKVKPKPKKIPWYQRFWVKGDDVVFTIYEHRPKFLIEHVRCDGIFGKNNDAFIGTIDEITLQQKVRNKPTTMMFGTKDAQSPRQFKVNGIVDLRKGAFVSFSGQSTGLPVAPSYWDTNSIPFTVNKGAMGLRGQFAWANGQLSLESNVRADGLQFSQTPTYREGDLFHQLMKEVARSTTLVDLKVRFEKGLLSMDSNLDEALARAMNQVIDVEKQKWLKLAAAQWDQLVGEPLRGFDKQVQSAKAAVDAQWQQERLKVDKQIHEVQLDIDKQLKSFQSQGDAARLAAEESAKQSAKQLETAANLAKKAEEDKAQKMLDQQKADAQKALEEKVKGLKLF